MNKTTINTTATAAVNAKFPAKYYDRQLLESAKTRFVHAEFGQKRPIPRNSGNTLTSAVGTFSTPKPQYPALLKAKLPPGRHFHRRMLRRKLSNTVHMLKSVTCSTLRHMTKLSMIPPNFSANSLARLWSGSHAMQCVQAATFNMPAAEQAEMP